MKTCEASSWNSTQVRRWLENEGFRDFWPFVEPDVPFGGQDLLSLTAEDWHKLFKGHSEKIGKPSAIRVRRLMSLVSRLKSPALTVSNCTAAKPTSDEDSVIQSDDDVSNGDNEILSLPQACPYCNRQNVKKIALDFKPERWKALLAFLYVLVVSWITAFVMVITTFHSKI